MAIYLENGAAQTVVDLGFLPGRPTVYGVDVPLVVDLGLVDGNYTVYGVDVGGSAVAVNLGYIENEGDVYGVSYFVVPPRAYRRIQLDGGGRILFERTLGDEAVEMYFELWRNGRPFPLASISNPVFSWKSPNGETDAVAARIIDARFGRVGVHLFEPNQLGTWRIQVKFAEEINYDPTDRDSRPPYAPASGPTELWRHLPRALVCVVRDEGGWGAPAQ